MKNKLFLLFVFLCLTVLLCGCSQATRISFAENVLYVKPGETITPEVNVFPKKFDYTLTIDNDTVARVDGKQVVGLRSGSTATLTAVSGDVSATAKLIVSDSNDHEGPIDEKIKNTYYATFMLVNYSDLGLESGIVDTMAFTENSAVLHTLPAYVGYRVEGWYSDGGCTVSFDPYKNPILADVTLYCRAIRLDIEFMLDGNDMISGILYPTLPHDDLVFPAELKGRTVKGVADNAFKGDEKLKTVTLPACYETIGEFAFAGCVNLTSVTVETGSALQTIGKFAFCVTETETTNEETGEVTVVSGENPCKNLTFFGVQGGTSTLPDTVSFIGEFAFGYCEKLVLNNVPSALTEIASGAFYGTRINNVDLTNVTTIGSFAFADCSTLSIVRNTQNVTECYPGAFTGTATYLTQYQTAPYVIYVDTILIGCNKLFGSGMTGNGKHEVDERTTLIADKAFSEKNQSELTLYISHPGVLFGTNVFVASDGVCVAVPEENLATYKTDNPAYRDLFCVKKVITVTDPNAVNFGEHTLLKFSETNYYYDKYSMLYSDGEKRAASVINIPALPEVGQYVSRINTRAINLYLYTDSAKNAHYSSDLTTLILGNPRNTTLTVAVLAVINCPGLTTIDLRSADIIVEIVLNSFQFSNIHKDCKIYVHADDLALYRTKWANTGVAYERLAAAE